MGEHPATHEHDQEIRDHQNPRRYFAMIPNIVDDSDLDPFERTLYLHYVRVGTCNEATETTAKRTKMSTGKVSEARKTLAEKGWIAIGNSRYGTKEIYILDRWAENMASYTPRADRPDEAQPSPHERRSPGESDVHHMNATFTERISRSPGETKKNQVQKPIKEPVVEETAPPSDFERVWKDIETLFPMVGGVQFQQFRDLWEQFPQLERHRYAFERASRANPRLFKFYLTDFASFNPDVPRTWGREMEPSAVAALPAGSLLTEAQSPPARLDVLAMMALPDEPLLQELERLRGAGRIQEEVYHASVKRYCAGLAGQQTAADLLAAGP